MTNEEYPIDDLQSSMEKVIEQQHYKDFDKWIENFSLNLVDIWNESSAHELNPDYNLSLNNNVKSAIVIGKGPSVKKHKHLELLANSDYDGTIICTDGMLPRVLEYGITPEKFPNFYVVTIDPDTSTHQWYDKDIVNKFGKNITGIFSIVSNPLTVIRAREAGIRIHWIHPLFDYNEGIKSFNYISSQIVRVKNHERGLQSIQMWLVLEYSIDLGKTLNQISRKSRESKTWKYQVIIGSSIRKSAPRTITPKGYQNQNRNKGYYRAK